MSINLIGRKISFGGDDFDSTAAADQDQADAQTLGVPIVSIFERNSDYSGYFTAAQADSNASSDATAAAGSVDAAAATSSETLGIAATGIIYRATSTSEIPLSTLFKTYNISLTANAFDAEITNNDGSYIIGPDGTHYGYGQLTPDITLGELNQTYFVPSGSSNESTVIAFNADADSGGSSLFSYPAVSVVLGSGILEGFDYPLALTQTQISAISSAGYSFVVRYYSSDGSEQALSHSELVNLENAGLKICAVFENKSEAGSYSNGTGDAIAAIQQATSAGQSAGSAIYFTIDDNVTSASAVEAYFEQILSIFKNSADNPQGYKVGVYGSGTSCAAAVTVGASYSWLNAASYSWSGTGTFTTWQMAQVAVDENAKIPYTNLDPNGELPVDALGQHQIVVGGQIFGVDIDVAKAGVDFGAFGAGSHITPTVIAQSVSVPEGQSTGLSVSISNPSSDGITQYWVEDLGGGSGHLSVGGISEADGQWFQASSNWSNVQYVGGASPGSDSLELAIYDSTTGSFVYSSTFTAATTQTHVAPSITATNISVPEGQSTGLSVSVSNPSSDGITQYWVEDLGGGSGHLSVGGTSEADGQWFMASSNWSNVQYVGGASPGSDSLELAIYDSTTGSFVYSPTFTAATSSPSSAVANDFNGDDHADILLQSAGGQIEYANMSGGSYHGLVSVTTVLGWNVVGQGNISGGADSDIVIQNGSQLAYVNLVNGGFSSFVSIGNPAGYAVVGVGDIAGNHFTDVVIQNPTTDEVGYANMNNGVFNNWFSVADPVGWKAVGVADINDDGYADILIQNKTTDEVGYANMSNGSLHGFVSLGEPVGYNVVGAGDVNGLGDADVVVQNPTNGSIGYANMINGVVNNWVSIGNPTGWSVIAVEDILGNGYDDIVIENNSTDQIAYANMTGGSFQGWVGITTVPGFIGKTGPGSGSAASSAPELPTSDASTQSSVQTDDLAAANSAAFAGQDAAASNGGTVSGITMLDPGPQDGFAVGGITVQDPGPQNGFAVSGITMQDPGPQNGGTVSSMFDPTAAYGGLLSTISVLDPGTTSADAVTGSGQNDQDSAGWLTAGTLPGGTSVGDNQDLNSSSTAFVVTADSLQHALKPGT